MADARRKRLESERRLKTAQVEVIDPLWRELHKNHFAEAIAAGILRGHHE